MALLTLAYANHRLETLPFAEDLMRRHQLVILEEPPDDVFYRMLRGECDIGRYVSQLDTEYPEFTSHSCRMYRKLHDEGLRFMQVEPYIERLITIHMKFADGLSPNDIESDPALRPIYKAEKKATRDLIRFYEMAASGSFEAVLSALKRFAQTDAARFRIRDEMRAGTLFESIRSNRSVYIEAGTMHVWLRPQLRRLFSTTHHIRCRHLMEDKITEITGRGLLMGPGDILTLTYIFNPNARSARCDQFASQSLIYSKLVSKEELPAKPGTFPHIRDEWRTAQAVRKLDISDCAELYLEIRQLGTADARSAVDAYLSKSEQRFAR